MRPFHRVVRALRQASELKLYSIGVRGFDFDTVYVRASSPARARYLCARSYEEAGWGTVGDGFRCISATRRIEDDGRPLASPHRGPEGICAVQRTEAT